MTPQQIRFLQSDTAVQTLGELALTQQNHLQLATKLRKTYTPDQVNALLETIRLRQKAAKKFSHAADMLFTATALEQSSSEAVARYRSHRFAKINPQQIVDLCCSIGSDALPLTQFAHVTGIDLDYARLKIAQHNHTVYGRASHFHPLQADLLDLPPFPTDALFFDPARRDERGKRIFSVESYRPPLSLIEKWRKLAPAAAVKISPGVDYREIPPTAEAEFISVNGEVKECVLWYGDLRTSPQQRATLLPSGDTLTSEQNRSSPRPITSPGAYLYEPDGAVIRAHLIQPLGVQLNANQIDPDIAYLTSDQLITTPFATPFAVQDRFPFQLKRLRAYLRERKIGRLELKKRGSPLDLDQLHQQLKPKGPNKATVFLTRINATPSVIIAQRLP